MRGGGRSPGLAACALLVAALLGTIATVIDITPAAAVIFAGIHEQPAAAIFVSTLTHPLPAFRSHQVKRRKGGDPEGSFQSVLIEIPLPCELAGMTDNLHPAGWTRQRRIQDRQVCLCRGFPSRRGNKDSIDRLAQLQRMCKYRSGLSGLISGMVSQEGI